jgi:hypothetical protein
VLSQINAAVGPSESISWVGLVYTICLAVGLLTVGSLSDIFGRRWFFIGGTALGVIGCIVRYSASIVIDLAYKEPGLCNRSYRSNTHRWRNAHRAFGLHRLLICFRVWRARACQISLPRQRYHLRVLLAYGRLWGRRLDRIHSLHRRWMEMGLLLLAHPQCCHLPLILLLLPSANSGRQAR